MWEMITYTFESKGEYGDRVMSEPEELTSSRDLPLDWDKVDSEI